MSATIIIDDALRAKVARTLTEMAAYRASLAARIKPEVFNEVVELCARIVALDTDDFEVATIVALSNVQSRAPELFVRYRGRPGAFSINGKKK